MRTALSILLVIVTVSCQNTKLVVSDSNNYLGPGHLRIRNGSDEDFFEVIFQGNRFGDIKKGQVTEYQAAAHWSVHGGRITLLPGDYPQNEISLRRAGFTNRTHYIWVDYSGRFVSGPHWFTFVLTLHGRDSKHLNIEEVEDD